MKVCFLNFYYRNSHLDCYHFYQHYEEHFEAVKASGSNRIYFAILFLCNVVV